MPAARAIPSITVELPDPAATERLGAALAAVLEAGDVVALKGPLGAGKTTLARAIIAARGGGGEVPSPTFTLVQTYALEDALLWHFDLYRLESPEEAYELAIEEAFADGISLIEWPERLGPLLPAERLEVEIGFASTGRRATLTAAARWRERLEALRAALGACAPS